MERWRETLSPLPAGSRAAFRYDASPESVILDLALQAAGLVSAPNGEREDSHWIERRGLEIGTSSPSSSQERGNDAGAVVILGGQPVEWTMGEIAASGERLQRLIGETGAREIVVLGGPLEGPLERTMMAWATLSGAAVVLEPDPALRAATAAWVRPTVFHGTPAEIADLRARVGKGRQGRLPFRRLRTVLAAGALPAGGGGGCGRGGRARRRRRISGGGGGGGWPLSSFLPHRRRRPPPPPLRHRQWRQPPLDRRQRLPDVGAGEEGRAAQARHGRGVEA